MIMTESGILIENESKERDASGSVPAGTTDMDPENVNEEKLDLTVSSSLNSKEISLLHGILKVILLHDIL
jgi:hypothetical protein